MPYIYCGKDKVQISSQSPIMEGAEELGVPFGCRSGNCGICTVQVILGEEHLSPKDTV